MKVLFLFTVLLSMTGAASAQYQISSWSIDSGGGRSTGGVHSVTGSIGQPVGGAMKSDSFLVAGGFFGFVGVVPVEGAPVLRLIPTPGEVILAWPLTAREFQLQETPSLTQPSWMDVRQAPQAVGSEYQVRLPWQAGDRFFRLRQP